MNTNREELSRLAGFIGAAMALAGYVRHSIQEIWGWLNLTLLIAGLVLLLASIVLNFGSIVAFFRGRSGRLGANMALLSVAVIGLIAGVFIIGLFLMIFRAIKHAKRKGKGSEDASAPKETRKPRSGRPVTQRAMDAAMKGGTVSGPTKNRILRALNAVLAQKKQEPVDLRAIF